MKLKAYVIRARLAERRLLTSTARAIGIHRNHLTWLINQEGNPNIKVAMKIIALTKNEVTLEDLMIDKPVKKRQIKVCKEEEPSI